MKAFKKVKDAIVALLGSIFPTRAKEDEFEHVPEFEADSEPPEFALTPPETDETPWYDDFKIVPAAFLPEGWSWKQYNDGSGSLKSPDGKNYFGYDLQTKEFMHPGKIGNPWCFFDGYPYECISFAEFKKQAEIWITKNVLAASALKSHQETAISSVLNEGGFSLAIEAGAGK